jgi:hypothetical protein
LLVKVNVFGYVFPGIVELIVHNGGLTDPPGSETFSEKVAGVTVEAVDLSISTSHTPASGFEIPAVPTAGGL